MKTTLKQLQTIQSGFDKLKLLTFFAFGLCAMISIVSMVMAFSYSEKQRQKIYVLDQGKSLLLALQSDKVANRHLEVTDHVKRFHELFFNLAPNVESIESNINSALNLADRRAYELYNDMQEQGYYSRLLQAAMSQSIIIDSVRINTHVYPYTAKTFGHIYIVRQNSIVTKSLITSCQLIDIARSDANPHGLLLEKLEILENQTINQTSR